MPGNVIVFPAVSALVSTACVVLIALDARRRSSPDKFAWLVAFALFSVAAGAEVIGSLAGWNPLLVRVYYVSGAMLVVGFLGLGQLYLLFRERMHRIGPGVAMFMVAVSVALISDAPIALFTEGHAIREDEGTRLADTVQISGYPVRGGLSSEAADSTSSPKTRNGTKKSFPQCSKTRRL